MTHTSLESLNSSADRCANEQTLSDTNAADACAVDLSALDVNLDGASDAAPDAVSTTLIGPINENGFAGFGFSPELLEALEAIGYHEPSPIQKAAIPELDRKSTRLNSSHRT